MAALRKLGTNMGKLGFGLCVVAAPAVSRRSPAFTNANSEYRHAAPEGPAPAVPADGMAVTQQADAEASMLSMDQIQAFLDHANEQMAMLVPVLVRRVAGEIEAFEKSDGALAKSAASVKYLTAKLKIAENRVKTLTARCVLLIYSFLCSILC